MTEAVTATTAATPVHFRTAIVPAAGMGTRFLPATKTVPKELLPVVDTPGIELVAGEAADSGAQRLVIVTSPGKDGVVAHFVEDLVLENKLEASGKLEMLEKVRVAPGLLDVQSVIQHEPLGLGHAVACAEEVLDDDEDSVAVLLPDDLVMPRGVLDVMARVRAKRGGSVLCAIEVPDDKVSSYGVFSVEIVPDAVNPNVLKVTGMVEKPKREDAPVQPRCRGPLPARPRDLRRPAPDKARCRRRAAADRRHCTAHRRRPSRARGGAPRIETRPRKSRGIPARCG